MVRVIVRATVTGAVCAIFTALANSFLHGPLEPVTVWTLVTAAYLVGSVDGWAPVSVKPAE